jgi:Tfp pilus assembly protein PilE
MTQPSKTTEQLRILSRRLEQARSGEAGMMLIELIIVMQFIAILLAIAVPDYLSLKVRANKRAASVDVRNAVSAAELYYSDPAKGNQTYKNMDIAAVKAIDAGAKVDNVVVATDFTTYCIHMAVGGRNSIVVRGVRATNSGLVQEDVAGNCPVAAAL